MTRIEDDISDRDLDKLVLRRELGRIEKSLRHLTSRWHEILPREIFEVPPLKTTWKLHCPPVSDTIGYQSLVVTAFQLQSLIDSSDIFTISNAISSFSNKLGGLGMLEDNLTVGLWAADFWKKIISLSPTNNLNTWVQLVYKLTNVSISYANIGDKHKAYATSREAINIIQGKLDGNLSLEVQELMARNLCIQAVNTCTPALMDHIELATRAALTMETVLNLQANRFSIDTLPIPEGIDSNSMTRPALEIDDTDSKLDSSTFHDSLYSYSTILVDLSNMQEVRGHISKAHITKKCALMILHSLLTRYPNSKRLLKEAASLVLDLCNSTFCDFNSLDENLAYAEEGTDKYRKLLQANFPTHIFSLFRALLSYNQFLSAGMVLESKKLHKEMSGLAEFASQRYQVIKLPSESDGDFQFYLASILYYKDLSFEGVDAARKAVEQYSALAFLAPDRSPLKLIRALTLLCKMLQKTNQLQSAVTEGFKALRLVDNAAERDKEIQKFVDSDDHISLIDCIMDALEASPPDCSSVAKASTLMSRFKNIFLSLIKFNFPSSAPGSYMKVLAKNGLVDDAINYGQDFLTTWERKHTYSDSDYTAHSFLTCATKYIAILREHNREGDALKCSTSTMAVAGHWCSQHHKDPIIHDLQCDLTTAHIELLCAMGLYETALELAQAASVKSCSGEDPSVGVYNDCLLNQLLNLAAMQLYNYLPLQAIETAGQAESLARFEFSKSHMDNLGPFIMLNRSIYILSDAFFDAARTSESLVHLAKIMGGIQDKVDPDWQSMIRIDNHLVSVTTARIFFVQSDYVHAKELMVKVLEMDRQLFAQEASHLGQLAMDVLFASIAFCCVNEHEAGIALLAELEDLQRKISVKHPALTREVKFDLEMQARRGQWRMIQTAARAKLTCNHADQALDLKMARFDSTGLEVAEQ